MTADVFLTIFRSVQLGRKLSVLFVGTSAARGNAIQRAFLAGGYDVSFEMPLVIPDGEGESVTAARPSPSARASHDLIVIDMSMETGSESSLILIDSRGLSHRSVRRQTRVTTLADLPNAVVQLLDTTRDIAPGYNTRPLASTLRELRKLIAGLPGVVFRCGIDAGGRIEFLSEQADDLCGYQAKHFTGHGSERLLALVHPADRRRFMATLQKARRERSAFSLEHRVICAGGEVKWVWQRGFIHRARRRSGPMLESFVIDITDRKREEQRLSHLATHDTLTGVANRSLFMEQVGNSMQRADRHNEMIACLFLDLDRFKRINDSFGHVHGDELLRQVADRLKRCVRGNDLIARLGGDEFVVLLDGIDEPTDAATASAKILDSLNRPYDIDGRRISTSASIGISCYPGDAADRTALLRNADAAMYSVKNSGRRGYRFYSADMSSQAYETLALTAGLRQAIDNGELTLHYQPRLDLRTGRAVSVEALARWESREFGSVPPARFVALAEDIGLIGQLGAWVLRAACRQAVAWDNEGLPPVRIAVNVSPREFRDDHLVESTRVVLHDTGIDPGRLELEITESTMMQDYDSAADILRRLKRLGVRLSIDDFGTGYSSLSFLKKFPLDYLKVDRAFITGVPRNEDDVAITEAIIAMAKRLNLRVVAEGIETEAQAVFVRSSDCDEGQGFLFSRPSPAAEAARFLRRRVH